jgi:hypothetical protein
MLTLLFNQSGFITLENNTSPVLGMQKTVNALENNQTYPIH